MVIPKLKKWTFQSQEEKDKYHDILFRSNQIYKNFIRKTKQSFDPTKCVLQITETKEEPKELKELKEFPWNIGPQAVEIVGTTFGNRLQTKILVQLIVANCLLTYLCAFATTRYFLVGN